MAATKVPTIKKLHTIKFGGVFYVFKTLDEVSCFCQLNNLPLKCQTIRKYIERNKKSEKKK